MKKTSYVTKVLALLLSVVMLLGMAPLMGGVLTAFAKTVTSTEVVYEKYTPNKSGQYIEAGKYIIYNHSRNCVFAGKPGSNGGITASTDFTINGNYIVAPGADVVSIAPVSGQTNQYYLKTSSGQFVSLTAANNRSAAHLVSSAARVRGLVNNNTSYVAFAETSNSNNYCLNAYASDAFGVYQGGLSNNENQLTLYRETTLTHEVTVPDFPEAGSVGLEKNAEGIDFQDTGLAKVNLSLTAVAPFYSTGVDVLFITDISNSMAWPAGDYQGQVGAGQTSKLQDMQAAVTAFTDAVMEPNIGTGMENNNTVTFCTFGGWDPDRNAAASTHLASYVDPTRTLITASADPSAVKNTVNNITINRVGDNDYYLSFDGKTYSDASHKNYGNTNYDYGFMEGYTAAQGIKQAYRNQTGKNYDDSGRQIFVIFISDGAPTNFNGRQYKKAAGPIGDGYYSDTDVMGGGTTAYANNNSTNANYTQDTWYSYIRDNYNVWATNLYNMESVAGMDTIGIDFANGGFKAGDNYWIFTNGGNYDLGFVLDSLVAGQELDVLTADDQQQLAHALADEAKEVSMLASYVSTTDKLGAQYSLQMASYIINPLDGTQVPLSGYSVMPSITVSKTPTVHLNSSGSNSAQVGTETGDPVVIEQVTFNYDGTEAYSNLINNGQSNILVDGVIRAVNFSYNTTSSTVVDQGVEIPAESFHWNISKLSEDKMTLSYYVNLDGSEDRSVPTGDYETNEYATITYKTYNGVEVSEDYEKPELPWDNKSLITVTKRWTDADKAHDPITAQVIYENKDGSVVNVSDPFTLSDANSWTKEVETDLSKLQAGGTYKVTDSVSGYHSFSGDLTPTLELVDGKLVKTNHFEIYLYNTPDALTSFDVTKTWGDIAVDDHADDPVEVELFCNGTTTGKTATLNKDNNWSYTFNDLPLTVGGAKAVYSAQEITELEEYASIPGPVENINASDVPSGATIIDDGRTTGIVVYEDAQHYPHAIVPAYSQTIRNEIDADLLRLRVEKKWSDEQPHDPVTVTVGYRFTNGTEQILRSGISLSADNDWTALVSLHKPEGNGEYFLTEQNSPEGYVVRIGEFTFTDEHTAEVSVYNIKTDDMTTAITASKSWADGAASHTGEAVEVELYINGAASGKTAKLSADNGWTYTFSNLPLKDENNVSYRYSIQENTASALYTASYSGVSVVEPTAPAAGYELVSGSESDSLYVFENAAGNLIVSAPAYSQTVTNTPKTNVNKIKLIVNKQWQDNLSSHEAVDCVMGYQAADGSVTVVSKGFTLSADTDWSQEIEVASCDTNTGKYILMEPTVDGYEPITGDLEIVDSTVDAEVFVPVDTLEIGGEYVIMYEYHNTKYILGADGYNGMVKMFGPGDGYITGGSVSYNNRTYNTYFESAPEGTVWSYTNQHYLYNVDREANMWTYDNRDTGNILYYGYSRGTTFYAETSTQYVQEYNQNVTGTVLYSLPKYNRMFVYYGDYSGLRTAKDYSHGYPCIFELYKKVTVKTGSKSTGITATNIPKLGDQTVVIDYGLPVQVNVADYYKTLGVEPTFVGLSATGTAPFSVTDTKPEGFSGASATYPHGQVAYANGKLTYTPTDMTMSEKDVIGMCFSLNVDGKTWYLYGSVTVVPATIMYYEDDFVVFTDTTNNKWQVATGANDGVYQGEDRPGVDETLKAIDANNVYGYDDANVNCTTYSNGKAHWVHVKNGDYNANGKKWPTATFTFTGTSFDLISVTARETGYIFLDVYQGTEATGTRYKRWVVDTYYGYTRARDGFIQHEWYWAGKWYVRNTIFHEGEELPEIPADQILPANIEQADTSKTYKTYEINYTWVPSENSGSLYQIPVIKSADMPYGTYTVVVTCAYSTYFDHTAPVNPATGKKDYTNGNYDFYFDAVRTYAPAEDYEGYNREYYTKDGEGWPQFIELRKNIISAAEAVRGPKRISGAVFFDSIAADKGEGSDLTDYVSYGPDNEVYLAPGQSISFALQCINNGKAIDTVQIGAKKLTGDRVQLTASHTAEDNSESNLRTIEIIASSDMYYNVGDNLNWQNDVSDIVTLTNVGQATVSITNVKITYKEIIKVKASFAPMNRRMIKLAASAGDAAYIANISECFHRYEFTVTSMPTETEGGIVTAVCPDCGNTFEIEIPALTDGSYETNRLDATAAKDGWVDYTWEVNEEGATVTFRVDLPALGYSEVYHQNYDTADDPEEDDGSFISGAQKGIRGFLDRILSFFRKIIAFISNLFGKG